MRLHQNERQRPVADLAQGSQRLDVRQTNLRLVVETRSQVVVNPRVHANSRLRLPNLMPEQSSKAEHWQ